MSSSDWLKDEYDVLVAGGGGAGLMAALEAAELGASVLLVEKQPDLGGATGMSIGSITAAGTDLQATAGVQDDIETHLRDYLRLIPPDKTEDDYDLGLTRLIVELAAPMFARLKDLGVTFSGPHPETPHSRYRMHNAVPDSGEYIRVLSRAISAQGVTVRTETVIDELRVDAAGLLTGAVVRQVDGGRSMEVRVTRGIVLTTGYFSANNDLASAHGALPEAAAIEKLLPHATGDGILLGIGLGAATAGMRAVAPGFRTLARPYSGPDKALFSEGAILVNMEGRRFVNELEPSPAPELATSQQPEGVAMVVFDSRLAARIATAEEDSEGSRDGWHRNGKLYLSTFPAVAYAYLDDYRSKTDYLFEANSIAGLAEKMQVPAADFSDTVAELNRAASGQAADNLGREPVGPGVSEAPFFAVGPIKTTVSGSEGGLKVDREMHVLDGQGRPIRHLYSAGANAMSGALVAGHGHALVWAFGTGQIAGRNAARER